MQYLIIFVAKVIEVTFSTLRIVLITKGERVKGSIMALFEIAIWVALAGSVLNGITEDPMKGVVYSIGFVAGCYLGSWIEERLAIGVTTLDIIIEESFSKDITDILSTYDLGYTIIDAHGKKEKNKLIIAYIPRKKQKQVLKSLNHLNKKGFITINNSSSTLGGYGLKKMIK